MTSVDKRNVNPELKQKRAETLLLLEIQKGGIPFTTKLKSPTPSLYGVRSATALMVNELIVFPIAYNIFNVTLSSDTLLRLAFMFVLNISLKSIFQRKCHNLVLVSVGLADWADRKYVLRTNNTVFIVIR